MESKSFTPLLYGLSDEKFTHKSTSVTFGEVDGMRLPFTNGLHSTESFGNLPGFLNLEGSC